MGFSTCVLVNQPVYLFAVFPTYAHDFPKGADIAMINGVQHHFPKLIEVVFSFCSCLPLL